MKKFISYLCCILLFSMTTNAQIPYGNNKAAGKHIVLNGVKHYYEVYGSGKAMLLIHGNRTGISGWGAQIAHFSKSHTVYAIDCRGRGHSEPGNDTLTYTQQAADMAAFLQQLQLDSVSVVGKSDGAIVAILMGICYPAHLDKIVAFGANMWPGLTALYPTAVDDAHNTRVHADSMLAQKDTTQNWEIVRQRCRMMEFQPHIGADDLKKIAAPVLVFSCDRDLIREDHTLFIYRHIPQAALCILPGETHHVARQNPELFNQMVDKFLTEPFRPEAARSQQ